MGWLSGWKYRKQITIAGTVDGVQTNYQMKLVIYRSAGTDSGGNVYVGSRCESDYDDIRITNSDGDTLRDYWVESSDAASATVWIEFDSIPVSPGTATFYLYYGNAGAAAVSNGVNTFQFFDHFDSDLSKWTGDTGKCVLASSIMTLTPTDGDDNIFGNTTSSAATARIRAYAYLTTGYRCHLGGLSGPRYAAIFQFGESTPKTKLRTYDGTSATNADSNWTPDAYKTFEMRFNGNTNFRVFENDVELTGSPMTTTLPNAGVKCYAGGGVGVGGTGVIKVDWIFIANYTANELAWSTWGGEENFILGGMSMSGCGR